LIASQQRRRRERGCRYSDPQAGPGILLLCTSCSTTDADCYFQTPPRPTRSSSEPQVFKASCLIHCLEQRFTNSSRNVLLESVTLLLRIRLCSSGLTVHF
ncbi:hypothetical protein M758_1G241500, partial [Ceratodon purpureus]